MRPSSGIGLALAGIAMTPIALAVDHFGADLPDWAYWVIGGAGLALFIAGCALEIRAARARRAEARSSPSRATYDISSTGQQGGFTGHYDEGDRG
jgi:hypothetical protein